MHLILFFEGKLEIIKLILQTLSNPDQAVLFLLELGIPEELIKKLYGVNYDFDSKKIHRETLAVIELISKNNISINLGGNQKFLAGTVGYNLDKIPLEIHFGVSKKWEGFFHPKSGYGIFAGVSIEF